MKILALLKFNNMSVGSYSYHNYFMNLIESDNEYKRLMDECHAIQRAMSKANAAADLSLLQQKYEIALSAANKYKEEKYKYLEETNDISHEWF